ncbi:MAG: hypothetical protein WC505_06930 [Patescibacteria group bacterium]
MPTQKTGMTPPQNPAAPTTPVPTQEVSQQAPTLQPGQSMTIGGREMTRMSVLGAVNEHMQTTGKDLFGNPAGGGVSPDAAQFAADAAQLGLNVTAEPQRRPDLPVRQVPRQEDADVVRPPEKDENPNELVNIISDQINMAHRSGNEDLANELRETLNKLLGTQQSLKKVHRAKKENAILSRLKADLGIQKIKPVSVDWGGYKWHFAPAPAAMDRWLVAMAATDGANMYSVLKVAISLVGIDGEPVWKVLGIELEADYRQDGSDKTVRVPLYTRLCPSCGNNVGFETDTCQQCGTLLDVFSMPLPLRLRCADAVNQFFQNDFGPYEQLVDLYDLLNKAMPDRIKNHNDIYPFLKVSQPQPQPTLT